jgi:hypothetical protein
MVSFNNSIHPLLFQVIFFIFRGQVPHSFYLPFLHCYLSLGQSESYVCYSIPTSTLFNLSCPPGDEHQVIYCSHFPRFGVLCQCCSCPSVPISRPLCTRRTLLTSELALLRSQAHSAHLTEIPTHKTVTPLRNPINKNLTGDAAVVNELKKLTLGLL